MELSLMTKMIKSGAKKGFWRAIQPYLFLLPAFIALAITIFYPILFDIKISATDLVGLNFSSLDKWSVAKGFERFSNILSDPYFQQATTNTVVWMVVNVAGHLILGLFFALLLNYPRLKGAGAMKILYLLPWAVPIYVSASVWAQMFNWEFGTINHLLALINIKPVDWLSQPLQVFFAFTIVGIWSGFPYLMVMSFAALQSIPRSLYEAAQIDGADAWQRFWLITQPLIKPVLMPAIILDSIWSFNQYTIAWIMGRWVQSREAYALVDTLGLSTYFTAFWGNDYGRSAALAVAVFLISAVLCVLNIRSIRNANEGL